MTLGIIYFINFRTVINLGICELTFTPLIDVLVFYMKDKTTQIYFKILERDVMDVLELLNEQIHFKHIKFILYSDLSVTSRKSTCDSPLGIL